MKIGIIGLGTVGKALKKILSLFHEIKGYDKNKKSHLFEDLLGTEMILIAVPTPNIDGRLDTEIVRGVVKKLESKNYSGRVCIKSTMPLNSMESLNQDSEYDLIYSPEFMRSDDRKYSDLFDPEFIVVAGKNPEIMFDVFPWVYREKFEFVNFQTAELIKLVMNSLGALKVAFTNEIGKIAENPSKVMQVVSKSSKFGEYYLNPTMGPFEGPCFPKDVKELMNAGDIQLLKDAIVANEKFKDTNRDD